MNAGARGPDATRGAGLGLPLPLALLLAAAGALLAQAFLPVARDCADTASFVALAHALATGHGLAYREPMLPWLEMLAFRSPGYPVLLAALLPLGGDRLALAVNGALAVFAAVQAGEITASIGGRRAGRVALVLLLLWVPAWWWAGRLVSETLFVALGVAAMRAGLAAISARSARLAALAGLLAAAATLVRPAGLAIAVALVLVLAWRAPRAAAAFALVAALAYAPWPVRNAARLGAPVPFTTNGGFNLCDGLSPAGTPALWNEMSRWNGLGELAIDARWQERFRGLVRANPKRYAAHVAGGLVRWAVPLELPPRFWLHRALAFLALAGMASWLGSPGALALVLAWAGEGAINALTQVTDRYRFPSEWMVAVFAALALPALERRLGPARGRAAAAALVALGVAALAAQALRHA